MTTLGVRDEIAQEELEQTQKKEKALPVIEIFGPTLQGEGPLAGTKTMFIRFGGCDFRCKMCDSLHAVIPAAVKKHRTMMKEQEIVDELVRLRGASGTPWVTLSGGNPAMWDLTRLCILLKAHGFSIALETQGSIWKDWFTRCQMVVLSPKSPGMGEKCDVQTLTHILGRMKTVDMGMQVALKIVIFSQQDIDFALDLYDQIQGDIHPGMCFFSLGNSYPPVLNEELDLVSPIKGDAHKLTLLRDAAVLVDDILVDPRIQHWRFFPQFHVLLYSNEAEK